MAELLGIDEHLVSFLAPASYEAEAYRTLADAIELMHKDTGLQVLGVTSPAPGDGKTTTAINLARTLARAPEARVLLVCADLRKPSVMESLGMAGPDGVGLVNAILDPAQTLKQTVQHLHRFNLAILPAGPCPDDPYEVLKSPRLGALLEEARQQYDYLVLDTPPLVLVPDCRIIARYIDGFLLVVAAHKTPRMLLGEALNLLDPPKVIGLVFNQDDRPLGRYYYNNYYSVSSQESSNGHKPGWWRRTVEKVKSSRRVLRSTGPINKT